MKKLTKAALTGVRRAMAALCTAIAAIGIIVAAVGALVAIGAQTARDIIMGDHRDVVLMRGGDEG